MRRVPGCVPGSPCSGVAASARRLPRRGVFLWMDGGSEVLVPVRFRVLFGCVLC